MPGPLLDRVRKVCGRLKARGWARLLKRHGLDLGAANLERALLAPLASIDRTVPGFEDFALEGRRAIEPGQPARSLLYHALASPRVGLGGRGHGVTAFPTPVEIETIEDFVYACANVSLEDLQQRYAGAPLAVAVFAREYRPAIGTVHLRHADLCYSRTGVCRVGVSPACYVPAARGYTPFEDDPHKLRVLPCRYAAYIAVELTGDEAAFGPLAFKRRRAITKDFAGRIATVAVPGDDERKFWVPLHKVFDGPECLRGIELTVSLTPTHVNEKLRRVHLALGARGHPTCWGEPALSEPPFVLTEDIAAFSTDRDDGVGLLVPFPHERFVEPARTKDGRLVTFRVPKNEPYASSFNPGYRLSGARAAPEYVHARHRLGENGAVENLNDQPDVKGLVAAGDYEAVQYVDYAADGWIEADCPRLAVHVPRRLAAYSVIAPVDYFPRVNQHTLMQWWALSSPIELASKMWPDNPGPPLALSDMRFPANVTLAGSGFTLADDTITAVVASPSGERASTRLYPQEAFRAVSLPDGAAGIFAPGWDSSLDRTEEVDPTDEKLLVSPGAYYLAAYGLGSPFPEDAKLCAALSAFWPAATPDITRVFPPGKYATATPLTDDVIGFGNQPGWDGTPGPWIPDPMVREVEYYSLDYVDWVEAALCQRFSFDRIANIRPEEYAARTLVTASVYRVLGAKTTLEKRQWAIYSFVRLDPTGPDWSKAADDVKRLVKRSLSPRFTYRYLVFAHRGERPGSDFRRVRVAYEEIIAIIADPQTVILKREHGPWQTALET